MATRPDLALLSPELPPRDTGGVGAWATDLAAALAADGRPPLLAAPARGGSLPRGVLGLPGRSWGSAGAIWSGLGALALRRRTAPGAALVVATWTLAPWAARVWPGPLLIGCHGSELTALDAAPPALRTLARRAVFMPVSAFLEGELRRIGIEAPAVRLPMALPDAVASPHRGRALVVLARGTPRKGIADAIAIAARMRRPLWVIGAPPHRLHALGLPTGSPPPPNGPWPGMPGGGDAPLTCAGPLPRDEARARLAHGACLLALSTPDAAGRRAEGLGLACLEAAAVAVPVVVRATGGLPEAAGPGLVLPHGLPMGAAAAAAIEELLASPDAGAAAQRWVRAAHSPALACAALDRAIALARGDR